MTTLKLSHQSVAIDLDPNIGEAVAKHAEFPPSALKHWEICPGFKNSESSGPAAEEGTMLHAVMEGQDPSTPLSTEQQSCIDWCREKLATIDLTGLDVKHEVKMAIANLTWGTADVFALQPTARDFAKIIDYKFGRVPVTGAKDNIQGQAYALAAFETYPTLLRTEVTFLMPRLDIVETHTFSREDVDMMRLRLATIIARRKRYLADLSEDLLNPVPSNCTWCNNKVNCHKMHALALKIAPNYDDKFEVPAIYHPSQMTDPGMVGKGLQLASVLEKWCESMKEHAKNFALEGQEIPGYELKQMAGKRSIRDALAAYLAMKDQVTYDEFIAACSVSATALEEMVKAKAERGKKGAAVSALKEKLADLGITVQGEVVRYLSRTKH